LDDTKKLKINTNQLVTKSNMLIEASYKLGLVEQKLILCIASNIQPDDHDFKTYTLPIKEFNKLLGIEGKSKYTELRKITKELMQKVFEVRVEDKVIQVAWLSYVAHRESEGAIDLQFHPFLRPYLLQLKREFTSYKLANVIRLKSSYAIRIYELLKQYERVRERTFSVDTLRQLLGAENLYPAYGNFKQRVLLPAQKELNKRTDISFEIEEIKDGRRVDQIKFIITSKPGKFPKQITLFDDLSESPYQKMKESALSLGFELTRATYDKWVQEYGEEHVSKIIEKIKTKKDIKNPAGYITYMLKETKETEQTHSQTIDVDEIEQERELLLYLISRYRNYSKFTPYWLIEEKALKDIEARLKVSSDDAAFTFKKFREKFFEALGVEISKNSVMTEEEYLKVKKELEMELNTLKV
jgi:plasmid replication initiation protein